MAQSFQISGCKISPRSILLPQGATEKTLAELSLGQGVRTVHEQINDLELNRNFIILCTSSTSTDTTKMIAVTQKYVLVCAIRCKVNLQ